MNREEYTAHREDYEKRQISGGAFILLTYLYIDSLEQEIKILKKKLSQEKNTLKDYKFTNCNHCTHKVDNKFTETCFSCKRYYGCYFERK